MPALSLFLVLAGAHVMMLAGREVPVSMLSPVAYLWQDALVALVFGVLARFVRRPFVVWSVYGAIVAYVALNVVVARVLPSPLTPAMLRAARGTLADSITLYVTPGNLALCLGIVALAAVLPLVLGRVRLAGAPVLVVLGLALVAGGPFAAGRIETGGWHRNAFGALLPSRVPAASGDEAPRDWRQSPFADAAGGTDLARFRGAAQGRNVVVVVHESVGARYLAPYGAEEDPMPNLTRLATEGLLFESAYSAYPESIKGLFAVLCSRHPAVGVDVEAHAAAECRSLAGILRDRGYRTGLFHSGRFGYLGMRGIVEGRGFDWLADAGTLGGRQDSSFGIDEASTVEAMLAWIDGGANTPFFLVYLPIAGHHPYATTAPGPFPPSDDRHRYLNAIHEADLAFGQLRAGLEARGLDDETLYVVFGDHGEAFGQHPGNIGHSFFLYDENVRVPYVIAAPGRLGGPIRAGQTVSVVDTAPTVLELLGEPVPKGHEGISALDGRARMAFFVTDYAQSWLGLIDGCHKLLYELDAAASELYDLCADPLETADLSESEAGRVEAYARRLTSWAAVTRAAVLDRQQPR